MPTPAQAAKKLKATAKRIERIADPIVQEAAEFAVESAAAAGGSFGRYVLIAEVAKVSNKGGTSSALVLGTPPGYWAIKSTGRTGGYLVTSRFGALNLRRAPVQRPGTSPATAFHEARPGPLSGDDRWQIRVVDATRDEYPAIGQRVLFQAIE